MNWLQPTRGRKSRTRDGEGTERAGAANLRCGPIAIVIVSNTNDTSPSPDSTEALAVQRAEKISKSAVRRDFQRL